MKRLILIALLIQFMALNMQAQNLICNPSFENNGQGSIDCWTILKDFTTFPDTFSTEVPVNGGLFSLRLEGVKDVNWDPYALTYLTDFSGQKIVYLSAQILALYGGQAIYLWLEQIRNGRVISSKSDFDWAFNGWKNFVVTDTLNLQPQDSLCIKIIQSTGQNSGALVDLVELSAEGILHIPQGNIKKSNLISPNPATDKIIIHYNRQDDAKLFIYDMVGKCVLNANLYGVNELDISSLPLGIYEVNILGPYYKLSEKLVKE